MNCKKAIAALGTLTLTLALASPVGATVLKWTAMLDPSQEVPPVVTAPAALGSAFGTLDDISGLLSWNISWGGLSGPPTAMHFHGPAAVGTNAGVQVNIGVISGLITPSIGSTTINAGQISDFVSGLWYINIHTVSNPGGEIRGQVMIVPEPATTAVLALGLLGIGFAKRRRAH